MNRFVATAQASGGPMEPLHYDKGAFQVAKRDNGGNRMKPERQRRARKPLGNRPKYEFAEENNAGSRGFAGEAAFRQNANRAAFDPEREV